jgi:hypothetical protein
LQILQAFNAELSSIRDCPIWKNKENAESKYSIHNLIARDEEKMKNPIPIFADANVRSIMLKSIILGNLPIAYISKPSLFEQMIGCV